MKTRQANEIDKHVASRLRAARLRTDITQEKASEALGISFQQIQKYERGVNRVSAGPMYLLCQLYGISVASLFDGAPTAKDRRPADDLDTKIACAPYGVAMVDVFMKLDDHKRKSLVNVAEAMVS